MERSIDLVIPMVFPQDPEWQREYQRCNGTAGDAAGTVAHVRYRSWGTEELLVMCCMKYMPWLRTIHILLAQESQVQPWMGRYNGIPESREGGIPASRNTGMPTVNLVFHRDFIPSEYLPCFSSPCIEMFLHRIPGLSERFIYGNDDMFPLSPLEPEDFFRGRNADMEGRALPCQHFHEAPFPAKPNIFQRKCLWQQNMVGGAFGKRPTNTWLKNGHSFAALLKSSCEEVWRRHGDEIRQNLSPLKRTDRSANQYVYQLYQHYSGQYVDHAPRERYLGKNTPTSRLAAIIRDPHCGILCLNDNEKIDDWEQRAAVVRTEIGRKLGGTAGETAGTGVGTGAGTGTTEAAVIQRHTGQEGRIVAIVHFNTPKLTAACLRSIWKHTPGVRVVVLDNSDRLPISRSRTWDRLKAENPLVEVIDNTRGQTIDFRSWLRSFPDKCLTTNDWGSAKHCYSVQWLVDYIGESFVLADSDILVKRDISTFWQHGDCAWAGEIGDSVRKGSYHILRLLPYLCWLNVPMMKAHGIDYFHPDWMWYLKSERPNRHYDTGAWFLRAVSEAGLPVHELAINEYMLHLGHASYRGRRPMEWVMAHRHLWE